MGLYGVEATPINCNSLRRLQGRTADAMVGRHQTMGCPEVALAISGKAGIEIEAIILWRRARMLRIAWHHRPEWRELMARMLRRSAALFASRYNARSDESSAPQTRP